MAVSSATSMLPPIRTPSLHLGPCNGGGGGGGPRLSGTPSQGNCYDTQTHLHSPPGLRSNSNTTSDSGTPPANLTEESMMVLSQSIDSIHTMGTSGGSESLDHQVRTLFVSGLPLDTKSRELYLLFRGFKGFHSAQLKSFSERLGKPLHVSPTCALTRSGQVGCVYF
uniref:RNA-binding protein with multiple splicing 2 n=1 Tax=Schistocephalus solidus TaxID=70667 RepID=A0A0V0JBB6_SCHSO